MSTVGAGTGESVQQCTQDFGDPLSHHCRQEGREATLMHGFSILTQWKPFTLEETEGSHLQLGSLTSVRTTLGPEAHPHWAGPLATSIPVA